MPTLKDIIDIIESVAPLAWQESWDNSGWQVCSSSARDTECSGALLTLDVTESAVEEARRTGANLIISHHPLLFSGLKQITGTTASERIVTEAIRHGIAIYSAHTNIDSAPGGVNFRLAELLGLTDIEILVPQNNNPIIGTISDHNIGLGCVGNLPKTISTIEFLHNIAKILKIPYLRHSEIATNKVSRVALCGGSGSEFIGTAINSDADLYLTADLKYHDFQRGSGAITIVDGGHFETEVQVLDIFYELISKKIATFAVRRIATPSNAVSYLSCPR